MECIGLEGKPNPKMRHRILLADDNLDEQFLAERVLKKILPAGSTVHLVGSGNEAIAYMIGEGKFKDRKKYPFPTRLITDLNMADGDGFDVLEFVRSNPGWSCVPRIIFSSSKDEDDIQTAFLLGASAYHLKGSSLRELEEQMQWMIGYWASSEVPPVDENGRLLGTNSTGRKGARYARPKGGERMVRPGEV